MSINVIRKLYFTVLLLTLGFLSANIFASDAMGTLDSLNDYIDDNVRESHTFYGLASYYNSVNYFLLDSGALRPIEDEENILLDGVSQLVIAGRFNVLLVNAPGFSFSLQEARIQADNLNKLDGLAVEMQLLLKRDLLPLSPELDQIRYAHLWSPLAWLAKGVEASLGFLQASVVSSWGWALVLFAVLLKLVLLPVSIMTVRFQRSVSKVQAALAPSLTEIKANYDGEEAHNLIMKAHKEQGVSPFYALKPILGSFIQIPILIAVFNALGEMLQFSGQKFLWIDDLAYPDVIVSFSGTIPMFGSTLSLLPFMMTFIAIVATLMLQNSYALPAELKRQKRNLYLMAAAFFMLFYPFPAVMVLYWALANIIQTVQQRIIKI